MEQLSAAFSDERDSVAAGTRAARFGAARSTRRKRSVRESRRAQSTGPLRELTGSTGPSSNASRPVLAEHGRLAKLWARRTLAAGMTFRRSAVCLGYATTGAAARAVTHVCGHPVAFGATGATARPAAGPRSRAARDVNLSPISRPTVPRGTRIARGRRKALRGDLSRPRLGGLTGPRRRAAIRHGGADFPVCVREPR